MAFINLGEADLAKFYHANELKGIDRGALEEEASEQHSVAKRVGLTAMATSWLPELGAAACRPPALLFGGRVRGGSEGWSLLTAHLCTCPQRM